VSKVIDFKPHRAAATDCPHYHSIICELAELTPPDRLSVIAAACDDDDLKQLAQLAAHALGFAVLDEIKKVFEQAFADFVKEPRP